jgi:beta-lactam-binding protein with PASTA domain
MKIRKYIFKFDFWMQVFIMASVTLILVFITIFMLRIITRHGEKIKVPDMKGYRIEDVARQTERFNFEYIVRDSVYDRESTPGTIIAQSPEAGSYVKNGRKFYITLAASIPPFVKMPNLHDLSLRQAASLLETYGIKIGNVITVPSIGKAIVEQYYKGHIIVPGTKIPRGSVITLEVGNAGGNSSDDASGSIDDN